MVIFLADYYHLVVAKPAGDDGVAKTAIEVFLFFVELPGPFPNMFVFYVSVLVRFPNILSCSDLFVDL